jgi:hypothetical protein
VGGLTLFGHKVRWNAPGSFKKLRRKRDEALKWIRKHRDELLLEAIDAGLKTFGKQLATALLELLVASVVAAAATKKATIAETVASQDVDAEHASVLFRTLAKEDHGETITEGDARQAVSIAMRAAQARCEQMYRPKGR